MHVSTCTDLTIASGKCGVSSSRNLSPTLMRDKSLKCGYTLFPFCRRHLPIASCVVSHCFVCREASRILLQRSSEEKVCHVFLEGVTSVDLP